MKKLYVRMCSLARFLDLLEENEFLQKTVKHISYNVFDIIGEEKEIKNVRFFLDKNRVKYSIKND